MLERGAHVVSTPVGLAHKTAIQRTTFLIVCLQVVAGPNIVNLGEEGASDMDSRESVESENMKSVVQVALTSSLNMPLRRALIRLRLAGHCVRVLHALAPRAC